MAPWPDADGKVIVERGNTTAQGDGDPTQHAELVASAGAWRVLGTDEMNDATLYASTEPCVMCAGAAYWTGIGRVVYGMSNRRLFEFTGDDPEHTSFALPCRDILLNGQRPITVIGPLLEAEAAQPMRVTGAKTSDAWFTGNSRLGPEELVSELGP